MAKDVVKEPKGEASDYSFRSLRDEMNRLFDEFMDDRYLAPFGVLRDTWPTRRGGRMAPRVDITENDKRVRVTAELPGMTEKDIELAVREGVLTLKGEKKAESEETKEDVHRTERYYGRFERSFGLPESVDDTKVTALFKQGVLEIILPKSKKAPPAGRKISIKAG